MVHVRRTTTNPRARRSPRGASSSSSSAASRDSPQRLVERALLAFFSLLLFLAAAEVAAVGRLYVFPPASGGGGGGAGGSGESSSSSSSASAERPSPEAAESRRRMEMAALRSERARENEEMARMRERGSATDGEIWRGVAEEERRSRMAAAQKRAELVERRAAGRREWRELRPDEWPPRALEAGMARRAAGGEPRRPGGGPDGGEGARRVEGGADERGARRGGADGRAAASDGRRGDDEQAADRAAGDGRKGAAEPDVEAGRRRGGGGGDDDDDDDAGGETPRRRRPKGDPSDDHLRAGLERDVERNVDFRGKIENLLRQAHRNGRKSEEMEEREREENKGADDDDRSDDDEAAEDDDDNAGRAGAGAKEGGGDKNRGREKGTKNGAVKGGGGGVGDGDGDDQDHDDEAARDDGDDNDADRNGRTPGEKVEERAAPYPARPARRRAAALEDVLTRAGVELTPDLRSKLPSDEEVEWLYGTEPVILGLDTCRDFRRSVAAEDRYVGVAGMFNTGTNLLSDLLVKNCYLPEKVKKYGEGRIGMRGQVPWGKHSPMSWRGRHVAEGGAEGVVQADVLPAVVVKDPLTWMSSMCRHRYAARWHHTEGHCPNLVPLSHEERYHRELHSPEGGDGDGESVETIPVRVEYSEANATRHESLAGLWNDWYRPWTFEAPFPRIVVRFEDLLLRAEEAVATVCRCAGGEMRPEFRYDVETAKHGAAHKGASGMTSAIVRYANATLRLEPYRRQDLEYANKALRPDLMEAFGYRYGVKRKETS